MDLYNGDCIEIMKKIPSGSIDMILCDLPYGSTKCKWDIVIPFKELWEQYERIIKDNGAICLFADEPFSSCLVVSNLELYRYELIWQKEQGTDFMNASRKPLKAHEKIQVFYKKQPTYNKQMGTGKKYKSSLGKKAKDWCVWGTVNENNEVVQNDGTRNPITILKFNRERGFHPTQKPVKLLEWLINTYTNEGEVVLDNCMGSGSTGVACVHCNRDFIGIEKDEGYYAIAQERITKVMR